MKRTQLCPKCGSGSVIADVTLIDEIQGGRLALATFTKPSALLFRGRLTTPLSAWVCADCGFMEFYAESPQDIQVPDP